MANACGQHNALQYRTGDKNTDNGMCRCS